MQLEEWAHRHNISQEALNELKLIFGVHERPKLDTSAGAEEGVQARARLFIARSGGILWRNNVGALKDDRGRFLRYGLSNESKEINKKIKSSDLIGITPIEIKEKHLGTTLGQFTAIECKAPTWKYRGTDHEKAQLKYLEIVKAHGGRAMFINNENDLRYDY